MAEKKNIPEIRFKGFNGEWEEKKLGDVANFSKGQGYSKGDLVEEGTPIILYGRLYTNYQAIINEIDTYVLPRQGSIYSNGREVIVPASGETAEDIARASAVVSNGVLLGGDLNIIYPKNIINSLFLALNISNGKQQRELAKRAQGKSVVHLRNNDLKEVALNYPNIIEQSRIGNYFQNLDKLITLHQRKYDKLVILKKAMLEKMFPKNGADVPEIRFKGFEGKWENKNVTEIGKVFIGLVTTMTKFYREEGTLLIRNSDIKNNFFKFAEAPIYLDEQFANDNSSRKLRIGDVVTVHTGDVGTSAVITKKEEGAIGFATINTRPNKDIVDSFYLSTYFNSDAHKSFAIKMSTGDGRTNYNLGDFFELIVPLPQLEEQKKIGNYFQKLNKLISSHQQVLGKLKNIKKACLEKMFV